MARSCTSHCHYAFLRIGEEDTMKGGKSCVLLRIALDQDALSFHVQPTALRAFFFPLENSSLPPPLCSLVPFHQNTEGVTLSG